MLSLREHLPPDLMREADLRAEVEATIRANLSSMAEDDDDTDAYADEVVISIEPAEDGGLWVVGTLDREPTARNYRNDGPILPEQVPS